MRDEDWLTSLRMIPSSRSETVCVCPFALDISIPSNIEEGYILWFIDTSRLKNTVIVLNLYYVIKSIRTVTGRSERAAFVATGPW